MKKMLCVILAMLTTLSLFACQPTTPDTSTPPSSTGGNSPSNTSTNSPVNSNDPAPEASGINPADLPPVHLLIAWAYTNAQPVEEEVALVAEEMSKYTKEKFNATVEFLPLHVYSYGQQINLMLASGEKLDLISTLGLSFASTVANEYLLEIDDLLDKYGQGIRSELGDYIQGGIVGGRSYAVPTIHDLAGSAGPQFIIEYLEKYDIDLDKINSIDDMTEVWAKIKAGESSGFYPLWGSQLTTVDSLYEGLFDSLGNRLGGIDYSGDPNKVVNIFETDAFYNRAKLVRSWFEAGYINPDAAISNDTFINMVNAEVRTMSAFFTSQKPGQDKNQSRTGGVPLKGKWLYQPISTTSNMQTAQWAIPYQSADPERAMMVLNAMYTDPYIANLMIWGIEGRHWVTTADGHAAFPAGVDTQSSGYNMAVGWVMGNQFLCKPWENDDIDIWEQTRKYNETAKLSPACGFSFNAADVATEVAACTAVLDEYRMPVFSGSQELTKIAEMNAKLYAAGLQAIINEKQAQYDAWRAANGK